MSTTQRKNINILLGPFTFTLSDSTFDADFRQKCSNTTLEGQLDGLIRETNQSTTIGPCMHAYGCVFASIRTLSVKNIRHTCSPLSPVPGGSSSIAYPVPYQDDAWLGLTAAVLYVKPPTPINCVLVALYSGVFMLQ